MRKLGFILGLFWLCVPIAARAVSCTGRAQYSAPGDTTCTAVSAGYRTTGCDANGNNCTGQEACTSTRYCENGVEKPCPVADDTTTLTTIPDTFYPYDSVTGSWVKTLPVEIRDIHAQTWGGARTSISACQAYYSIYNGAGWAGVENMYYNPANGKYDVGVGQVYYRNIRAGYYVDTRYSSNYCASDPASHNKLYRRVIICPAGYYCPGGGMPSCTDGPYEEEWGRIECPAGSYCPAGAGEPTPCPAGTYSNVTGATNASVCKACAGPRYSDIAGSTECTPCPTATALKDRVIGYWYWSSDGVQNHVSGCRAEFAEDDPRGDYTLSCSICNGDYGFDGSCSYQSCMARSPTYCIGGYRWANYDLTTTLRNVFARTLEEIKSVACVPAGAGYYSPEGDTEAYACPDGLTTAGYGPAADEAADCGHTLHMGDAIVHLRSEKRTKPALHVRIGDDIFYGDMSTELKGHIRVKISDTVYSVFDDSM